MKASSVVLLVGLFVGAVAEELSAGEACTAEDSSESGIALVQSRPGVEGQSGPVEEDDVEETTEANEIAEAADAEVNEIAEAAETGELFDEWMPKKEDQRPCDRMPKWILEKIVASTNKAILGVKVNVEKCKAGPKAHLTKLEPKKDALEKCISPYGAFVEDSVSEEEDGDEEAADELVAEFDQPDEVDESVDQPDDVDEPGELVDGEVEKPDRKKPDGRKPSKKPKSPIVPCEKLKKRFVEKIIAEIEEEMKRAMMHMARCDKYGEDATKYLSGRLDHFAKCLEAK